MDKEQIGRTIRQLFQDVYSQRVSNIIAADDAIKLFDTYCNNKVSEAEADLLNQLLYYKDGALLNYNVTLKDLITAIRELKGVLNHV